MYDGTSYLALDGIDNEEIGAHTWVDAVTGEATNGIGANGAFVDGGGGEGEG